MRGRSASRTECVRDDRRPLALAGLWAGWRDPATETRPADLHDHHLPTRTRHFSDLHDRMPVVIPEGTWGRWLDPEPADPGELLALLEPRDDLDLDVYAVPRLVNDVRRDGP